MRRAAFAAGCVTAAVAAITACAAAAVTEAVLEAMFGNRGDRRSEEHPIDADHHIDLTDYEAHSTPHVEVGHRDNIVWVPLAVYACGWPN